MSQPDVAALLRETPDLARLARRLLRGAEGAEDALQDAWVRLLERPDDDDPRPRVVLERVARARRSRESRRAARDRAAPAPSPAESAAAAVERSETARVLLEEVAGLEPAQRDAVLLRFVEGWTVERVAEAQGVAPATVRTRVHRALPRLRERLERRLGVGRDGWLGALLPLALEGGAGARVPSVLSVVTGALGALSLMKIAAIVLPAIALVFALSRVGDELEAPPHSFDPGVSGGPGPADASPTEVGPTDATTASTRAAVGGEPFRLVAQVLHPRDLVPGAELVPAAGIRFEVEIEGGGETIAARALTTDAAGRFELAFQRGDARQINVGVRRGDPGRYRGVEKGLSFYVDEEDVDAARAELADVKIELVPHGALDVIAEDLLGRPVANVEVVLEETDYEADFGPEIRVVTDTDGRARIEDARIDGLVEARAPGMVLEGLEYGEPQDRGGWSPMRLVFAAGGTLSVRVVDDTGAAVKGMPVHLKGLSLGPQIHPQSSLQLPEPEATDDDGLVTFRNLPGGRPLEFWMRRPGGQGWRMRGVRDGRLVIGRETDAPRIVVPPNGELALEAVLPSRGLRGIVVDARGEPMANAAVELALPGPSGHAPTTIAWFSSDSEGRFEVLVERAHESHTYFLAATHSELDLGGSLRVSGAPWERKHTIVVREGLSIAGRVEIDRRLAPNFAGMRVAAVPVGPTRTDNPQPHWGFMDGYVRRDGTFEIDCLAEGSYELVAGIVGGELRTRGRVIMERSRPIEAGTRGVVLRLGNGGEARLVVRGISGAGEVGPIKVWLVRQDPAPAGAIPPDADRRWTVRDAHGVPAGLMGAVMTIASFPIDPDGTALGRSELFGQEGEVVLTRIAPGPVRVVAKATRTDGGALRPMVSEWLGVGTGEHEIVFDFVPAAVLEGRLAAGDPEGVLRVQMVDAAGRVFQTHRGRFTDDSLPLLPNGRFRIEDAPVGELELRFGTAAELEAGRPRKRAAVEVIDGTNPPVVVTGN